MTRPLIMVAPTGARRSKTDHPSLPLSVPEIVTETRACHAAGADALHLHVRDVGGGHSLDPGLYREALTELHTHLPDFPVQITTEAAGVFDVATQAACVFDLRPDWISLSVREMARDVPRAARLYAEAKEMGCRVQHILFDDADMVLLEEWRSDGTIPETSLEVIHVLGRYEDGPPSDPDLVADRLAPLKGKSRQMLCAFGQMEHACLIQAALDGADLRVGFENSFTAPDGTTWASNAASVAALIDSLKHAIPDGEV